MGVRRVHDRPQGRFEEVAVAVADRLVPMITEVTTVNERIMRLRITHTLGVISPVFLYAPTGLSGFYMKEAFYAQLQKVLDSCSKGETSIVLGDRSTRRRTHVLVGGRLSRTAGSCGAPSLPVQVSRGYPENTAGIL